MNEFLDLLNKLNLSGYAARDIIAGEKVIRDRLSALGPQAIEDDSAEDVLTEFDGLTARLQEIEAHLLVSRKKERQAVVEALTTRSNSETPRKLSPLVIPQRGIENPTQDPNDPYSRPHKRYSLQRAVARFLTNGGIVDGYEGECSTEIATRRNQSPQGFFMPLAIQSPYVERADVTSTVGASLNQTTIDRSLISLLRNRLAMNQMGVTVMNDLEGTLQMVQQTGTNTTYWVAEGTSVTDSNATFSNFTLAPNTLGATTTHSRKFLLMQSIVTENWLRDELTRNMAIELDRVGINGSGSGAEPRGILNNTTISGAATVIGANGGPITFANAVKMETVISASNADIGSLGYLTNTKVRGSAKTILEASASGAKMTWTNNEINGYKAVASNQVPSTLLKSGSSNTGAHSAMIFGNFADAIYAFWSSVDILVNPYVNDLNGGVRIRALIDADFKVRRTDSFNVMVDLTT